MTQLHVQVQRHVSWQGSKEGQSTCMSTYVPYQHVMASEIYRILVCPSLLDDTLYHIVVIKTLHASRCADRSAFLRDGWSTALCVDCLVYNPSGQQLLHT